MYVRFCLVLVIRDLSEKVIFIHCWHGKIVGRVANVPCKSPSQRSAPKIHLSSISLSESVIRRLPSTSLRTHQVLVNEG
ncbi:hypothetical protein L1987_33714 [Smallanthus sonchifolius]|uniref:Uncharacterized protein n=1 Tax=Smallanthus sonchifolius TaxID=185202 RepID=A0ACB9HRV6_9ASTR|nr:hypothetical protein L1987_33714 [Smallanthus sonchifolius]